MIPAVANGIPFPLVRPSDGNVKNVLFGVQPHTMTINGQQVILQTSCIVLVDGSPTIAAAAPPVTLLLKVNGSPILVVGSMLTLPSGHAGPVPPLAGAGPAINVS